MKTSEAMSADVGAVEAGAPGAPVKRKRRKWEAVSQASVNLGESLEDEEPEEGLLAGQELYTVESICRAMGLRRRVVVEMRSRSVRGREWGVDASGEVGMSGTWCEERGLNLGALERLPGGRTTLRAGGVSLGLGVLLAERECDGVRVRLRVGGEAVRSGMEVEAIREGDSYVLASKWGWKLW